MPGGYTLTVDPPGHWPGRAEVKPSIVLSIPEVFLVYLKGFISRGRKEPGVAILLVILICQSTFRKTNDKSTLFYTLRNTYGKDS